MGFESVLAQEIKDLGFESVHVFDNKVEFEGTLTDICRVNLWLRTAGRIYIKIAEFKATTFDDLFEQTKLLDWAQWIQKEDQFPVTQVSSRKSELFSKSDCQAIVKKAVVESLKAAHNCQILPESGALFPIRIQIDKDIVTLSIDSSGTGLNKRGYRAHMDLAPLRETLAAGLVLLSRWRADKDPLVDPFCGTGTILIEAGLIAKNMAPGLNRSFCSEQWSIIEPTLWTDARSAAKDAIRHDAKYTIIGSDKNQTAINVAHKNIELAGLNHIDIQKKDFRDITTTFDHGKLITNPPYGERMNELAEVEQLYYEMGSIFKTVFSEWSYYILSPNEQFETLFGKKSTKHRKLYNGGMKCYFYQYFGKN